MEYYYIVKTKNKVDFDAQNWYTEAQARSDRLCLFGNVDYKYINADLDLCVYTKFEQFDGGFDDTIPDSDLEQSELVDKIQKRLIKKFGSERTRPLTNSEINRCFQSYLKGKNKNLQANFNYSRADTTEQCTILRDMLSIIYDKPFICGIIEGTTAKEWQGFVCPASMSQKIKHLSALYFGTGNAGGVSMDKLASPALIDQEPYTEVEFFYAAEGTSDSDLEKAAISLLQSQNKSVSLNELKVDHNFTFLA